MKVPILFTFILSLVCSIANGQLYFDNTPNRPPLLWQKCYGGSADEMVTDVVFTNDGMVVACNAKSNDGDITGHHGSTAFNDGWVFKIANDTVIQWQISIGGTAEDNINKIISTNDGGFLCIGTTSSVDGDISNNHGGNDVWIVKLSSDGDIVWSKAFGGSNNDEGVSVLPANDGGYIFIASTESVNGDVQTAAAGNTWIVKLDANGTIVWQNTIARDTAYPGIANPAIGIVQTSDNTIIAGCIGRDIQDTVFTYPNYDFVGDSIIYFIDSVHIDTLVNVCVLYKIDPASGAASFFTKTRGASYSYDFSMTAEGEHLYLAYMTNNLFFKECTPRDPSQLYPNYEGYNARLISKINIITGFTDNTFLFDKTILDCYGENVGGIYNTFTTGTNGLHIMPGGSWVLAGEFYSSSRGGTFVIDAQIKAPGFNGHYGGLGYEDFNVIKAYPGGNDFVCGGFASPDEEYVGEQYDVIPQSGRGRDCWITKMTFDPNRITGTVKLDTNSNNLPDLTEPSFKKGIVKIKKYGAEKWYGVDENGTYEAVADTGTYTIQFVPYNENYFAASPAIQTLVIAGRGQKDTVDFAVHQTGVHRDYAVTVSSPGFFRPGFNVVYQLACTNNGTDTFENRPLRFVKDPRLVVEQPIAGTTIAGDTITWDSLRILPFSQQLLHLPLRLAAPPAVNAGDTLFSYATIDTTGDEATVDNYAAVKNPVTGSYDPNDKNEQHAGAITKLEVNAGNYLTYTIRFQNTGTDTAFNIVVRDSLDPRLLPEEFEMISASHPYHFKIEKGKYVTWTFTDINLVDSFRNEPASHGYITYRIKPKANLAIGEIIKNDAAIYFDFNLPVSTNTTHTAVIKTTAIWTGKAGSFWSNPANWNVNAVPDAETIVIIPGNVPHYPVINSHATCSALKAAADATITLNEGFTIDITGK